MNVRSLQWHSFRKANRFRGSATSARDICFHLPARLESVASTLSMLRHAFFVGTKRKAQAPAGARAYRTHRTQPRPRAVTQQRPRGVPRDFSAPSVYARTPPTFERLALGGGNALVMGFNGSMYRLGWVMCPLASVRNAHGANFLLNTPSTGLSIDYSSRKSVDRLWGAYNTKREGLLFDRSSL